ncbi:MAG: hypothetical protein RRZ84_04830 [Romboutsia sp.]
MNSSIESTITQIVASYNDVGGKKLLKKTLKELGIDRRIFLYYSNHRHIPICALPRFRIILTSKQGFVSFCYNFYTFIDSPINSISISPSNIKSIAKFVVSHEAGHILDPDIYNTRAEYSALLSKFIDKLIEYNIDVSINDFHKGNLPLDLEECALDLKRNLIDRESKAWDIARSFLVFDSKKEELIFEKIREYALATYNFGTIKNIVKEHNIDVFFKYKRHFA